MARRKDPATEVPAQAASDLGALTDEPGPAAEAAIADQPEPPKEAAAALDSPAAPIRPEPQAASRPSGFLGMLLGGALIAAGGYGLGHFNLLGLAPGGSGPDQTEAIAALETRLAEATATAEAERSALAAIAAELETLSARIATLETRPAAEDTSSAALAALAERLDAIESIPADGAASTAALAAQLAELQRRIETLPKPIDQAAVDAALARLDAAEAEAKARADAASAAAAAADAAQRIDALRKAVASGSGFEAELAAVADPDLQAALAPHVTGVATLGDLQAAFPDAARAVLIAARAADPDAGWSDRILDFLAGQTGARSLTPRDGTDPDAILSRAEFALGEGRLADALAEVATLDPALLAPLEDWTARAKARLAVTVALEGK